MCHNNEELYGHFHVLMTQYICMEWRDQLKLYSVFDLNWTNPFNFLLWFSTTFYDEGIISFPFYIRSITQHINWLLNFSNWFMGNSFVKISVTCSFVDICSIRMVYFKTCDLKLCNLTDKCLVHAPVFWLVAIPMQLLLSSKIFYFTLGVVLDSWMEFI